MAFRDLADVLDVPSPKILPINGTMVEFPGRISAASGALLILMRQKAVAGELDAAADLADTGLITDARALELEAELLGDGVQQLDELGVFGDGRARVVQTLMAWHMSGQEAAEAVWEGKAQAPRQVGTKSSRPRAGRGSRTAATLTAGGGAARSRAADGAASGRRTTTKGTSARGSSRTGAS